MATLDSLEDMIRQLDARMNLLTSISERQQTLLERLDEQISEVRRNTQHTQRIWVHLCRKYGWLEDDDLFDPQ